MGPKRDKGLDARSTGGLIATAGSLVVYSVSPDWFTRGGALALAVGLAIFLVFASQVTKGWHWFGKALVIFGIAVATILPGYQVYATYRAETAPPDNLLATFTIADANQFGATDIDFKVNFINGGSRDVTIKDLGAFIAYRNGDAFHPIPPCSITKLRPESVDAWYGNKGLKQGPRAGNDIFTLYSASRSTLDESSGVTLPAHTSHSVPAHVAAEDISKSGADEIYLCPIIRYFDFDGVEKVVVCDAYHFRKDGNRTRYPGSGNKAVRLLPHAENSQCVSDDVPADTHVISHEEQALP